MANSNEYMRVYMLARYHRRRAFWVSCLGGKCEVCGKTEGLEFDHVDESSKSFDVAKALTSMAEAKLDAEMSKCQLLCKDHHKAKSLAHSERKPWQHGTLSGYRYCKCAKCSKAKAEYMKSYRA